MDEALSEIYKKHIALPEIRSRGQERLLKAKVLVVGVGGLGCPVSTYLSSCGVDLVIADHDRTEPSNLPRQFLYNGQGEPKAASAAARLGDRAGTRVRTFTKKITEATAGICREYDLVVDCTDNSLVRCVLSDACLREGTPLLHAAISDWVGQVTMLCVDGAPCYRCICPGEPKDSTPSKGGVLAPVPGVVGTIQALEAVKYLSGMGTELIGRMMMIDLRNLRTDLVPLTTRCAHLKEPVA